MQQGFTRGFLVGKPSLFAWHVARTEDTIRLRRSSKDGREKKKKKIKAGRTERKIHKPPWCRKWHSRLNIMLLVTASVADRLVGCWLERDCLPVCRRSRPHTLLTSATEQRTIQQRCSPTGAGQTGQPITRDKISCMQFLQRMQHFLYSSPHAVHLLFSIFETDAFCERHDVTAGPGSEMWIPLTMQFKEIHI